MLIPYSTDAPVYYWPFATVGLIVVNVALFAAIVFGELMPIEDWMLWYGNGLHPLEWFQSIFMHASIEHLVGNMIFLWVFGLVVEGKLGWWKFLLVFLAVGGLESMVEQIVMLGAPEAEPGSLGASAAIFGLIAIAAIWAPKNEVTCFWLFGFRAGEFDISIAALAITYVCIQIVTMILAHDGASWLHLAGFAIGLPIGIVLLKRGIVDCEGWDAFNVWSGNYGACKDEGPPPAEVFAKVDAHKQKKDEELLDGATKQIRFFLENKNAAAAVKLCEKMRGVRGGVKLERAELLAIIQGLHAEKRWKDSAHYMAEYIARFPEHALAVQILLAQICVMELQRPAKAIELLGRIESGRLTEKQAALVKRIRAKASQMSQEGDVELDVETW
jgi:membrane associated rhomboid family serine protease